MKKFKQDRANKRFVRELKLLFKQFKARSIQTMSCYIQSEMIHFILPNNYKIGIWQWSSSIFAQHLGCIDKFKPSYSEFSAKYSCLEDVRAFIELISKERCVDGEIAMEEEQERMDRFRQHYHEILNMKEVYSLELRSAKWSKTLCITMVSEDIDEEIVDNRIDKMLQYEDYLYRAKREYYDIGGE